MPAQKSVLWRVGRHTLLLLVCLLAHHDPLSCRQHKSFGSKSTAPAEKIVKTVWFSGNAFGRLPIVNHAKHQGLASTANMVLNTGADVMNICLEHRARSVLTPVPALIRAGRSSPDDPDLKAFDVRLDISLPSGDRHDLRVIACQAGCDHTAVFKPPEYENRPKPKAHAGPR
jgi:hypothetical protein